MRVSLAREYPFGTLSIRKETKRNAHTFLFKEKITPLFLVLFFWLLFDYAMRSQAAHTARAALIEDLCPFKSRYPKG